ncbi:MAG: SDR family NAD(P)-dependent oxidoreductase [Myxococcales bacterium]
MATQKKTILIVGYGPGISKSAAKKFAAEGFSLALVARNAEKLEASVQALRKAGVEATGFPADAGDPAAIGQAVREARTSLGPIHVILWNAYGAGAGDLLSAPTEELRAALNVPVLGLLSAVQAALPDLKRVTDGAVLVTNGGLGLLDANIETVAIQWNAMGLAVANAAKHKLVRLLAQKLKAEGVYVGEVMVMSTVKGTAFDNGSATLDPDAIAETFWNLYQQRNETSVQFK